VQPEELGKMIKFNYLIGSQTGDLPAYSRESGLMKCHDGSDIAANVHQMLCKSQKRV
jgi:hypothetical protein